eukprot:4633081-Pyramimonas_sp.AAC.1
MLESGTLTTNLQTQLAAQTLWQIILDKVQWQVQFVNLLPTATAAFGASLLVEVGNFSMAELQCAVV